MLSLRDTTVLAVLVRLAPPPLAPPPLLPPEDVADTADGFAAVSFFDLPNQFIARVVWNYSILFIILRFGVKMDRRLLRTRESEGKRTRDGSATLVENYPAS
mmetsp:Transcript_21471/g.45151  ORF Transcript_21471/g.45151 Transcript_21471/m.45151 type:complete len:102 (-) Transcript_21471:235-540(-)